MKKQANNHQTNLETFVQTLSELEGLSPENMQATAQEIEHKAAEIMKIYLDENPDSSEAIEFLCLGEGGEVTHYEVMSAMTNGIKDKKFATKVKSILEEEKRHLQLCIRLAKQMATA